MSNENENAPAISRLVGVVERAGEHKACSLVFMLETECGQSHTLTYGHLIGALRFSEQQAVIPAHSAHWWARIGDSDGCTF